MNRDEKLMDIISRVNHSSPEPCRAPRCVSCSIAYDLIMSRVRRMLPRKIGDDWYDRAIDKLRQRLGGR